MLSTTRAGTTPSAPRGQSPAFLLCSAVDRRAWWHEQGGSIVLHLQAGPSLFVASPKALRTTHGCYTKALSSAILAPAPSTSTKPAIHGERANTVHSVSLVCHLLAKHIATTCNRHCARCWSSKLSLAYRSRPCRPVIKILLSLPDGDIRPFQQTTSSTTKPLALHYR